MRNLVCAICAALALAVTWSATNACYPRTCDPTSETIEGGKAVDNDTWESVTLDESWHDFRGGHTIEYRLPAQFKARRVVSVEPYVAFNYLVNNGSEDFTLGSGDISEILLAKDGIVKIRNGTCANLYIRTVVTFATDDRGVIPDAGAPESDASSDASQ